MARQPGFFDIDNRLKRLSDLGDQLEAHAGAVDFEIFRADLDKALACSDGSRGGRAPFDPVLMFKILIIRAQNNLSDDRAEFLISDRLSFMRFLGLGLHDRVPDAKTIRAFRERLTRAGAIEALFARFDAAIREAGFIAPLGDCWQSPAGQWMSGRIVDSTLVAAPKQRNSDGERKRIKAGQSAAGIWPDDPRKARQKGERPNATGSREAANDARWTIQFSRARSRGDGPAPPDIAIPSFGCKAHASIDRAFRFIRRRDITDAASHDGRMLRRGLLDQTNTGSGVWADSACRSKQNEAFMQRQGFTSHVHRRKPAGKPMPAHIRRGNGTKSKHRAPVEHVFAVRKNICGLTVRTIGLARARAKIGLVNIACNIRRLARIGGAVIA